MKRLVFFIMTWVFSVGAGAVTPDQYSVEVLQKDLPRSLRWFAQITRSQELSQVEIYSLYQNALPATQLNQQLGISVKDSLERMILLLEGARYFEPIQLAPLEYQNKKERSTRILQTTKDQMDRFEFGEDPQILAEEWRALGITDIMSLTADLVETFMETQRLLKSPVMVEVASQVEAQVFESEAASELEATPESEATVEPEATPMPEPAPESTWAQDPAPESTWAQDPAPESTWAQDPAPAPTPSFENQRFSSYVQSLQTNHIAPECAGAQVWKTDQAESCQSDDPLECDRRYARECKKLQ